MYIIILILLCSYEVVLNAQEGFFCVPVADLVAVPFQGTKDEIEHAYESLSLSPEYGQQSCLRVRQGIFNESVTILAYENDQVHVVLKNCFSKQIMSLYNQPIKVWTLKKWVLSREAVNELPDYPIFPPAYGKNPDFDKSIIALAFPWYDDVTDLTYSAGTRFCLVSERSNEENFCITLYNAHKKCSVISYVPRTHALCYPDLSYKERRKQFVKLLYAWCNQQGPVPFVWGGTSFTHASNMDVALTTLVGQTESIAWQPIQWTERPLSGLDASGLIVRAAQICGIEYFCCNSQTVANTLPILSAEDVQEGDILWAPGYLGIVASLDNNEIIEAQGYGRGYGKVHCITLQKRFQDILTWNDFFICCQNHVPLKSLDSQGRCVAHIPLVKIYRLPN
jgi:hypothetical protein